MAVNLIPIDLGGGNKGAVKVPDDVVAYFNITKPTGAAEEMVTRSRKAHQRASYAGLGDTTPKSIGVKASTWQAPIRASQGAIGKNVKIPTELKTANGNLRYTSLNFPGSATVGAISNWLATVVTAKKPTFFFHNGNRYSVLRAVGDVNKDETPETTTDPTP